MDVLCQGVQARPTLGGAGEGTTRGPHVQPCAHGTGRGALPPSGACASPGAVSLPGCVLPVAGQPRGGGSGVRGSKPTRVLQHHPLEAGAVHDGRAGPRARGGRGHGLSRAAEEPCVEEAHVRHAELVGHFRAGPHVAESKTFCWTVTCCGAGLGRTAVTAGAEALSAVSRCSRWVVGGGRRAVGGGRRAPGASVHGTGDGAAGRRVVCSVTRAGDGRPRPAGGHPVCAPEGKGVSLTGLFHLCLQVGEKVFPIWR